MLSIDPSHAASADLEDKDLEYNLRIILIRRYFYRECREIDILQSKANSEDGINTILCFKRILLIATDKYLKVETETRSLMWIVCSWLGLRTAFAATAAVLFNTPQEYEIGVYLSAAFLYMQLAFQIVGWFVVLRRTEVKTYTHLLFQLRARSSG
jgi:hypothetical protein